MRFKVYVTRKITGIAFEKLKEKCEVTLNLEDRPPTEEELVRGLKDKNGLISLLTDLVTKNVIDSGSSLKVISNYAAGYDNIDVEYATTKKIMVTNTPGVLTSATAELAWALLFATIRRIVEADKFIREDKFKGWAPNLFLGTGIERKVLGIIGAGRIGTAFGLKSKGFNLKVLYTDLRENPVLEKEVEAERVPLKELLKTSDFVSVHLPLNPDTKHLIGREEINYMKPASYLINTSRGEIIDEIALIEALKNEKIRGAGLDVYEDEPHIPDRLKNLNNCVLLPHIGSATKETREKMAIMAVENLITALEGGVPKNLVNTSVL